MWKTIPPILENCLKSHMQDSYVLSAIDTHPSELLHRRLYKNVPGSHVCKTEGDRGREGRPGDRLRERETDREQDRNNKYSNVC
jgi:hypothetical protein